MGIPRSTQININLEHNELPHVRPHSKCKVKLLHLFSLSLSPYQKLNDAISPHTQAYPNGFIGFGWGERELWIHIGWDFSLVVVVDFLSPPSLLTSKLICWSEVVRHTHTRYKLLIADLLLMHNSHLIHRSWKDIAAQNTHMNQLSQLLRKPHQPVICG